MRVLVVSSFVTPHLGGVERFVATTRAEDYPAPNNFTGTVNWVEIEVGTTTNGATGHQVDPDEFARVAMARQ